MYILCSEKITGTYSNQKGNNSTTMIYNLYEMAIGIVDQNDPNKGVYMETRTSLTPTSNPTLTITESNDVFVQGTFSGSLITNVSTLVAVEGQFKIPF